MKNSKGSVLGLLLLAFVALVAMPGAAEGAKKKKKPTITMSGSTTVAPLATMLAKGYVKACKGCVKFKILQGGSDIGVADVARGRVTVGMSSRIPKPSDPGGIVFNQIAKDALCIATHKNNRIANLTQEQVQSIFAGEVRNWNLVQGAKANGTVNVVIRTQASGTQDAFDKIFMTPKKTFSGASQKASNGLIQQQLQRDPLAIGYISLAFKKGVSVSNYKGVPCSLRAAKSGQYPGTRPLFLVTRGKAKGATKKWLRWVRNNKRALKIASTEWVPFK